MILKMKSAFLAGAAIAAFAAAGQAQESADPRQGLAPGLREFGEAAWNMELVSTQPKPDGFGDIDAVFAQADGVKAAAGEEEDAEAAARGVLSAIDGVDNSDLAFNDRYVFAGNYNGFNIYAIDPAGGAPSLVTSVVCPGGQGDLTVHGDLLFMSVQANQARLDCGTGGTLESTETEDGERQVTPDPERFRGVRIFDISQVTNPVQVGAVQTCRGSHTHTLVPDPADDGVVYIYNQGTSFVRPGDELGICSDGQPEDNAETALYSIDVIRVPLDNPAEAAIVNRPRIFADVETGEIAGLWRGGRAGVASQRTAQTNHCHDITAYPELGIAGGACSGNGIILDITDPENPARIDELFDPDMAYWHSATFSNDGSKVVFTDEWGGGGAPRCTPDDPDNWGANLIADLTEDRELIGRAFHKIPNVQSDAENCVAHNGNLVPVPGRDLFIQAWYQGGVSLMDFTDSDNPVEIAYFDRGPLREDGLAGGGHWSAYWHNGRIYGTAMVRGLDVFRLAPSDYLSEAEIAAAEQVMLAQNNPQTQTRIVWADTPEVAHAYLDQLARGEAVEAGMIAEARATVDAWASGEARARDMRRIAGDLDALSGTIEGRDAERLASLAGLLTRAAG